MKLGIRSGGWEPIHARAYTRQHERRLKNGLKKFVSDCDRGPRDQRPAADRTCSREESATRLISVLDLVAIRAAEVA